MESDTGELDWHDARRSKDQERIPGIQYPYIRLLLPLEWILKKMSDSIDLRNIAIIAFGSRGDIQPYCAIGIELQLAGYNVRVLTNENHRSLVESFGLTHVDTFFDAETCLKTNQRMMESMASGDTFSFFMGWGDLTAAVAPSAAKRFRDEMVTNRPDLLIVGTLCEFFQLYAMVDLKLPTLRVMLQCIRPSPRAQLGIPTLFGLHNLLLIHAMGPLMVKGGRIYDDAFKSLPGCNGVMSTIDRPKLFEFWIGLNYPVLICKPSLSRPILCPTAESTFKFVGAAVIDKGVERCERSSTSFGGDSTHDMLVEFLNRDDRKPVYMGWGSMICKSPEHMAVLAVDALRKSDKRGIILGGWANLSLEVLDDAETDPGLIKYAKDNVLFVDSAPHEWLFPRVEAIVHHGGAGTTSASLRSGQPTIITPCFLDQFDHAFLVDQLGCGVGFSKQFQKIGSDELADALSKVTTNASYRLAAKSVAEEMYKESGAKAAVEETRKYWINYVKSGSWLNYREELMKRKSDAWKKVALASAAVLSIAIAGKVTYNNIPKHYHY